MASKRFYWIKLKTDFFNLDEIDFLLSQKNGCEYIVLYQMLCLKTANNDGRLCSSIGEMLIPYDIEKIVRETKHFDSDTVIVALELFKKLGLIFEQDDGVLKISAITDMVGSETSSAKRVREYRERKALQCNNNVTQEIEYREKSKELDKKKDKEDKSKYGTFDNVLLTPTEYKKLQNEFSNYQKAIDHLSEYIEMRNYKVKSHYLALRKWVFNALKEEELKARELEQREKRAAEIGKQQSLKELKDFYGSSNFEQRGYTSEEINGMYDDIEV